jgi:signal transduction histidine kinase
VKAVMMDDYAVVTLRDRGIGLEPAEWDRIFDRFERVTPKTGNEGLGLGLWITRGIAEAHGGKVSVNSTPHESSVFTLCLPRQGRQKDSQ